MNNGLVDDAGQRLRVAVVGAGRFGRFHALHYANSNKADLVAIVDHDKAAADAVAKEIGCMPLYDHRDLVGIVEAASVAVPATAHYHVARDLLLAGIDTLVEKPLCDKIEEAEDLIAIAARRGKILQVGHIERYSTSFVELKKRIKTPVYFESNRISPWTARNIDADVILDLMIHDIDMIVGLANSKIASVSAVGAELFSGKVDLASARLIFESGCVANITASRVSHKIERNLRIFQSDAYLVCDFVSNKILKYSIKNDEADPDINSIANEVIDVKPSDSLANEIAAFLTCVQSRVPPIVDGRIGLEALIISEQVKNSIQWHREKVSGKRAE